MILGAGELLTAAPDTQLLLYWLHSLQSTGAAAKIAATIKYILTPS